MTWQHALFDFQILSRTLEGCIVGACLIVAAVIISRHLKP